MNTRPRLGPRSLIAIGAAVAVSRWLLRAPGPDDYDSFSFLLAVRDRFDLASFQPQFPGYPVYVILGRALAATGLGAETALLAINACASGVTAAALAVIADRHAGRRAALATAALYAVAWLPLLGGAGMLSEPLAGALATVGFALLAGDRPRPLAAGLVSGLLLGVRASYWPLAVSFLVVASARRRHLAGLALGLATWLPVFAIAVGPGTLVELGLAHLHGHFESWGNSVVTRPDLGLRLARFCRDVFLDGLAPDAWALAVVAVVAIAVLAARRRRPGPGSVTLAIVVVPYALWAFFAQNIIAQPRHVLPLVLALILLVALSVAPSPTATALCVAAVGVISLPLAIERHTVPAAPAQAAAWAAEAYRGDAATAIFASRSVRFFADQARAASLPWTVESSGRRADVYVQLGGLDRFPDHIVLTDELDLQPDARLPGTMVAGPRFCRDPRIDRAVDCVQLYELAWRPR